MYLFCSDGFPRFFQPFSDISSYFFSFNTRAVLDRVVTGWLLLTILGLLLGGVETLLSSSDFRFRLPEILGVAGKFWDGRGLKDITVVGLAPALAWTASKFKGRFSEAAFLTLASFDLKKCGLFLSICLWLWFKTAATVSSAISKFGSFWPRVTLFGGASFSVSLFEDWLSDEDRVRPRDLEITDEVGDNCKALSSRLNFGVNNSPWKKS